MRASRSLALALPSTFVHNPNPNPPSSFPRRYPLILSCDSDGGITLIPVRPYLGTSRYKSILRFENAGSTNYAAKPNAVGHVDPTEEANCAASADAAEEPCAASVMEVYYDLNLGASINDTAVTKGRHLAITGDEQGWVRVFDISLAIEKAGLVVPKEGQMPKCQPSYNPYRRCTRDGLTYRVAKSKPSTPYPEASSVASEEESEEATKAARQAERRKARVTKPQFETSDLQESLHIKLVAAWPAHVGSLTSIEILDDPQSILTAGVDGAVHAWDFQGNVRGCLTQGREADSMWKRSWAFPIDKVGMEKAKIDDAIKIYDDVKEMERKDRIHNKKHAEMVAEMAAIRAKTPTSRGSDGGRSGSPKHHHPRKHHSR